MLSESDTVQEVLVLEGENLMKEDEELMTEELDEELDQEVHTDHLELDLREHGHQEGGQSHQDTGHQGQDLLD